MAVLEEFLSGNCMDVMDGNLLRNLYSTFKLQTSNLIITKLADEMQMTKYFNQGTQVCN